ncbi:bifunctional riboflavin kinase/FMN adenylyltransferase [Aquisphaera giovannonii]|uniref:Bifunctional riboflavin kinase/FMN adenylyltransferase n=1 Tax=Aquisphaera giovannonii TaxID=406548 RepID=A0A5B9VTH8_9BACT|nr:hypothetical protein [Aquisphaera giovannonii]QEH31578.1 bifunctional riboflavin kinase/FMN adenylyltransferase [Aquisphaera giovannonii]
MNLRLSCRPAAPVALLVGVWDPVLPEHLDLFRLLRDDATARGLHPIVATIDPNPGVFVHAPVVWQDYDDLASRLALQEGCGLGGSLLVEMGEADLQSDAAAFLGAVMAVLPLGELWLGRRQSFGSGPAGSLDAILAYADSRGVTVRRLAPSLARFTCRTVRQYLRAGRLRDAIELVRRPPARARPDSGSLPLPWAPGDYLAVPVDGPGGRPAGEPTCLTLSSRDGTPPSVPWPGRADWLAFLAGPADGPAESCEPSRAGARDGRSVHQPG